jgi:ADP-ribose pyrophosphatase YjhB (NUDIX family)
MPISPYIQKLRSHVGHDLLLIPSASVLVEDHDDRLLLARQVDFGQWATIGGAIDPGESPREAARREVREEVGLDVELVELLDVVGGPDFTMTYPNGDRVAYISSVFRGTQRGGHLRPDGDEVNEAQWFPRSELNGVDLTPFALSLLTTVGYLS